ncbi:D-2-hydroxyglutarate dehydrogenase YdiJ [Aliamphritea spongicola]|uniref:D-2-hydroxyglutarate dehydrogenase YdiJ n=1 Tax=Aliamphritea spongicola TaxID=707589 RepID=UPI00196B2FE4|nr:FAD-binding and (Fe-S)-binding domain-containing protein [Aliamphritea spongicola]MBN3561277.1 FAD-binding oxidoreductase [Aliamphritea spongicola]
MIPRLDNLNPVQSLYLEFFNQLTAKGFAGDVNPDYANRVVLATDNSIYQVLPQGVVYPKQTSDLVMIAKLASEARFKDVVLAPRGGGTGTNGQSLTDGVVVDISRHMNQILEINAEEGWVRVQTGVVKDQLNAALKPHGLFFAPELSTSNRATIGGMINTDASGQGSCLYGKTRDHVLALNSVFLDGSEWLSEPMTDAELEAVKQRNDKVGEVHRLVDAIHSENRALIVDVFPPLNRCLTGYDLAHIRTEEGLFDLNSVLCGAEGSLAFITEAKLNVLPIPEYAALVNIKYAGFQDSLEDAKQIMGCGPTSVETIDSKVLSLAMQDIVWQTVEDYFPQDAAEPEIKGINLVEYTAASQAELEAGVARLTAYLDEVNQQPAKSFGYSVVYGSAEISKVWAMRKKAVGLLGNAKGQQRPIPFVEDTAVPPENLAPFIAEFRALLDQHGLAYGMFGHVDAGVLHVRPAMDMKDEVDEALVRTVTDGVVALTQKYNGLLWGEHGKGVRSEYAPAFFGELYPQLQRLKAGFDPFNQLNPGKIATPADSGAELLKIDEVPTRGQQDRLIPLAARDEYSQAMFCNGNGACYNYDPKDAMCPSWKVTRERKHSPKGRSSLVREWLKQLAEHNTDPVAEYHKVRASNFLFTLPGRLLNTLSLKRGQYDFNHEVYEAMQGCLSCKSCVAQCPIKVNVPDFRARFLELYYGRYMRPVKDYLLAGLEPLLPALAKWPGLYNALTQRPAMRAATAKLLGLIDNPAMSPESLAGQLEAQAVELATVSGIARLNQADRVRSVILVQDAFTSHFEVQLVLDVIELLQRLGFNVLLAPFMPNGKPLHVHGFMKGFEKTADRNTEMLKALESTGVPLVGIDPAMTLTYRQEYRDNPERDQVEVQLLQEWLAGQSDALKGYAADYNLGAGEFVLLAHCTEKTSAAASMKGWQQIFADCGQTLTQAATGCCGMSGTYGHEAENADTSAGIYKMSWSGVVNAPENRDRLVATGYSCRSQVKRQDQQQIPHPLQRLLYLSR